ncbi:oxygen-independent coproporphyrinogen III oxidase [Halobacteriovorax sp. HLS]|uniref:oxygen-independent coproporphyrinogen III oxidase n=1 Tax=Halobacteriovorax sp. HLS TaxID=2234000 RepID=UPI000FDB625D|nr:oxygen-independent coproporphyrinogen III oxidase [Halobacteriovorax sp. HLS]
MENLIKKYSTNAPRYTSYPPLPFWNGAPELQTWFSHLRETLTDDNSIDLYIHIPFCEKLCRYCGCQRVITRNRDKGTDLVEIILKEWDIYKSQLGDIRINSIHFGGGTPTFLRPQDLDLLLSKLSPMFNEGFIGAMEIDPRTCLDEHIELLVKYGFNKVSLGIQDFDLEVQEAITRIQPFEMVKTLVDKLNDKGIEDINFDLIYGLPKQTLDSVSSTIEKVVQLAPSSISFYSYAHVPWKISNQKLINEKDLATGIDKFNLFVKAREEFSKFEYIEIGFDHFAKKGSLLANAKEQGYLTRNFMGYTHKKASALIGLGPSSISYSLKSFLQNEKDVGKYTEGVKSGEIAVINGHIQSELDLENEKKIIEFLCHESIELTDQIDGLSKEFIADELGEIKGNKYVVTDKGRPFMRNFAMLLDPYMSGTVKNFSKTI